MSATIDDGDIRELPDHGLETLVHTPGSRQVLHVGYGAVLTSPPPATGGGSLDTRIRDVLADHRDEYLLLLERHLGRHLLPFSHGGAR